MWRRRGAAWVLGVMLVLVSVLGPAAAGPPGPRGRPPAAENRSPAGKPGRAAPREQTIPEDPFEKPSLPPLPPLPEMPGRSKLFDLEAEPPPGVPPAGDAAMPQGGEKPGTSGMEMEMEFEPLGDRTDLPDIDTIRPLPPTPIPEDPPPHEGALFDLPHTIDAGDLVIVEVLETLPGRPITGERLVRPDGTISLGFYGTIHVRGLTLDQVKEKVVLQVRKFVRDEVLGLWVFDVAAEKYRPAPLRDVDTVFVDITQYSNVHYYVKGEVPSPGALACTGHDTVLMALTSCGGLLRSADRKDIRLFRPARGRRPARVYPIDLDAIEHGEARSNYQLFPDDRLVVGRDAAVAAKADMDRFAGSLQSAVNSLWGLSRMTRAFKKAAPDLTPAESEALMKEWFGLWWQSASQTGGAPPDEATFRELLLKPLRTPPRAKGEGRIPAEK